MTARYWLAFLCLAALMFGALLMTARLVNLHHDASTVRTHADP